MELARPSLQCPLRRPLHSSLWNRSLQAEGRQKARAYEFNLTELSTADSLILQEPGVHAALTGLYTSVYTLSLLTLRPSHSPQLSK